MKFWFTRKSPKDAYDLQAPYDATVEQALRVAQEVNAASADGDTEVFDFANAFRANEAHDAPSQPAAPLQAMPPPVASRPTVSRAAREEMERRIANYRAFQIKLNDEREARIRRTMDELRARLKQPPAQNSSPH